MKRRLTRKKQHLNNKDHSFCRKNIFLPIYQDNESLMKREHKNFETNQSKQVDKNKKSTAIK